MPVLATDKPLHLSSHDVVARARRELGTRRVGHTGTLDPLATGVVVLCVDDSTKLVQFMERDRKEYLAWVSLGASTPTLDAEGPAEAVPPEQARALEDWFGALRAGEAGPTAELNAVLRGFLGQGLQVPPQYSALQVGGVRAYAVARAGGHLELPARPVEIHALDLLGVYPNLDAAPRGFVRRGEAWEVAGGDTAENDTRTFTLPKPLGEFPTLLLRARVGSGTYLRSLARDLGAALGFPAHLSGLVRTRAGRYDLAETAPLGALAGAPALPDLAALDFPTLEADDALALALRQGKRPAFSGQGRFTVAQGGRLVAVADGDGERLKVVRVWAG